MNPVNALRSSSPFQARETAIQEIELVGTPQIASLGSRTFTERAGDFCQALGNSRIVRHLVLATGVALAVFYFATPPGWFTLGIGALAGIVAGTTWLALMGVQYAIDKRTAREPLAFEISTLNRLRSPDYNEILPNLYLGGMPNRAALPFKTSDWDRLQKIEKIGAIISVNSDWERKPRGPSFPYQKRDCEQHGIAYLPINSPDHAPLTVPDMNRTAEFIHAQLKAEKKVYVHCRAGKGRSAMAIAAYLIKYKGLSAQAAIDLIKARRPNVTVHKKSAALEEFARQARVLTRSAPP